MGAYFLERIDHTGLYCHLQRVKIGDTCHWMFISAKCQVHFVKFGITKKLDSSMPLCILLLTINDVLNWYPILFCVDDVNQRCLLQPMQCWEMFQKNRNFSWQFFMTFAIIRQTPRVSHSKRIEPGVTIMEPMFYSFSSDRTKNTKLLVFFVTLHFSRDKSRKEVQLRLPITWL